MFVVEEGGRAVCQLQFRAWITPPKNR
jgi:hypothetical protein